jgi:hypothetical protein
MWACHSIDMTSVAVHNFSDLIICTSAVFDGDWMSSWSTKVCHKFPFLLFFHFYVMQKTPVFAWWDARTNIFMRLSECLVLNFVFHYCCHNVKTLSSQNIYYPWQVTEKLPGTSDFKAWFSTFSRADVIFAFSYRFACHKLINEDNSFKRHRNLLRIVSKLDLQ